MFRFVRFPKKRGSIVGENLSQVLSLSLGDGIIKTNHHLLIQLCKPQVAVHRFQHGDLLFVKF